MKIERFSITRDDVELLLTMEGGGFDYWAQITYGEDDYRTTKERMKKNNVKPEYDGRYCYEQVLAYMICDTEYPVYVYDFEDDTKHLLTMHRIENGFLLNAQNRPEDASLDDGDAETGDCILQYAVFGDIVYG